MIRLRLNCAAAAGLLLLAHAAHAQPGELALRIDLDAGFDSNPFQLPKGSDTQTTLGRSSDSTRESSAKLRANLTVPSPSAETGLDLAAGLGSYRYEPLDRLNHSEIEAKAKFRWRLGDWWVGNLQHENTRAPTPMLDGSYLAIDEQRQSNNSASANFVISTELDIPLQYREETLRHQDLQAHGAYDQDRQDLRFGLRYRSPTGSMLKLESGWTDTTFPNRSADQIKLLGHGWKDQRLGAELNWVYSSKTQLALQLDRLSRRFNEADQQVSNQLEGGIQINYSLLPNTQIKLQAWRRAEDSYTLNAPFVIAKGLSLTAIAKFSSKTESSFSYTAQTSQDAGLLNDPNAARYTGQGQIISLTTTYQIARNLYLRNQLQYLLQKYSYLDTPIKRYKIQTGLTYNFETMQGALERANLQPTPTP